MEDTLKKSIEEQLDYILSLPSYKEAINNLGEIHNQLQKIEALNIEILHILRSNRRANI